MPSLHFGYSLLIGVSIMQLPLALSSKRYRVTLVPLTFLCANVGFHIRLPSFPRLLCLAVGFLYPLTILVAIVATANHYILDAVAGGLLCLFAMRCNELMTNLLPLEDCIFWCLRLHKPVHHIAVQSEQPDEKPWS